MAQPIVKYTLSKQGRVPEWLSTDSRAFAGEHSITGNKSGKIPRYESPQDTIFLGVAAGDPDSDGTPDDYVGTFANKTALQTYLVTVGNALKYKTETDTVTGVQTSVTTSGNPCIFDSVPIPNPKYCLLCDPIHLGIQPALLVFAPHSPENPVSIPARTSDGILPPCVRRY